MDDCLYQYDVLWRINKGSSSINVDNILSNTIVKFFCLNSLYVEKERKA